MGKLSKNKTVTQATPKTAYSNGDIVVNGNHLAQNIRKKDGTIQTSYNMNDKEKNIQNTVQSNLESSLANLFNFSDEQRKEWSDQLNAMKTRGIEEINNLYTPMETNLKNDIASRFGNFDNSIFMDNLNSITDKKAKAVADLSQDLTEKEDSLYENELANRMNLITLLNNLNSVINENTLSFLNAANNNSALGNSYNNKGLSNTTSSSNSNGIDLGKILSSLGKVALSYYTKGAL